MPLCAPPQAGARERLSSRRRVLRPFETENATSASKTSQRRLTGAASNVYTLSDNRISARDSGRRSHREWLNS
jgi:hypothetical protein